LSSRRADLAIVPTTVGKSPDWPVIAILRQNVIALIVPAPPPAPPPAAAPAKKTKAAKPAKPAKPAKTKDKDSDADDTDDDSTKDANKFKVTQLAGKRVGIVTGNEASPDLLNVVLNHYGVPIDKVQVSQIDPANLAEAIRKNAVDVLFVAGAATGPAIGDAVTAATRSGVAPTFIEIDQADGIAKRDIAFDSVEIDAGTFGGIPPTPNDKLTSLSFAEYLVARRSFSHNSVAELAKLIYTSRLSIAAQMGGDVKIEAPSTDKDADAVVHQGALDYLNDSQQSFFDKYGDDIFYGMLIFPVFGSAIAGLASYLRSDSRTRRLRLLQRVLDLVRKVPAAQTLEAIEHLQAEADTLVIAIIHLSEHEEFDESVRMSFSFALDQLRFATAARRAAIIDHAGTAASAATAAGAKAAAA
jgi:NMT1-like family